MGTQDYINEFPYNDSSCNLIQRLYSPKSDCFEDFALIYQILCAHELL